MPYEILNDEITVKIGEGEKEESFVFAVPGPRAMAKIGQRAAALRRADAPESGGTDVGLDAYTSELYDAFAVMEMQLLRADARDNWPFSAGANGAPTVQSEKFGPTVLKRVLDVRRGFYDALATFLD